jgi:hypothetical protein
VEPNRYLTPKGPRIHCFKMINSIDHNMENIIHMELNFISLKSVKNITCVGKKPHNFEQKEVYIGPTPKCIMKHEA